MFWHFSIANVASVVDFGVLGPMIQNIVINVSIAAFMSYANQDVIIRSIQRSNPNIGLKVTWNFRVFLYQKIKQFIYFSAIAIFKRIGAIRIYSISRVI